jgi:hypothetical protein
VARDELALEKPLQTSMRLIRHAAIVALLAAWLSVAGSTTPADVGLRLSVDRALIEPGDAGGLGLTVDEPSR